MKINLLALAIMGFVFSAKSQQKNRFVSFEMYHDVTITIDRPVNFDISRKTILILYALPNGNTTAQTMGKKTGPGDDWHFDIQHIKAQTNFIRNKLKRKNIVVVYLENKFKSWPAWKKNHSDDIRAVQHIVDTLYHLFPTKNTSICLSSHSGGGRFIFSYLDGVREIPQYIDRIVFLDSDYGYEPQYAGQFVSWLHRNKSAHLEVFAYNDSIALYKGKRFVSDTGGTWYRSHLMQKNLSRWYYFKMVENDSLDIFKSSKSKIAFYFKTNPDKKVLHTKQVELNGFIHSVLAGTKRESVDYTYFGKRAYIVE